MFILMTNILVIVNFCQILLIPAIYFLKAIKCSLFIMLI